MKRIKAACIRQTLVFSQKEGSGFSREHCLELNREEVARYKAALDRAHTRYQIDAETENPDGSIVLRVRKEYNALAPVGDYFD
ncbi:MAG: hypothetical protein IJ449_00570 [Clostridia bacterium]|nr:hypothetical protein [Clostridia bacterium]